MLGELIKAVNLTPYRLDPTSDAAGDNMTYRPSNSDDIIYGDLGKDFLRGGRATTSCSAPRRS